MIKYQVDPLSKFINMSGEELMSRVGFIPTFIDTADNASLKEQILSRYGYRTFEISGGELNPDGTYQFPGDPLLYPIMSIAKELETVYIYKFAIVAFTETNKETYVTRMD